MIPWIAPLITPLFKIGELLFSLFRGAAPLRVSLSVQGMPLRIVAKVGNTSKNPVMIRQVRVHYGSRQYSSFFRLATYEPTSIGPRDFREYQLPYENTVMGQQFDAKLFPPRLDDPTQAPPWESATQLLLAIANGNSADSWLELDYDLTERRRFCRGQVKTLFQTMAQSIAASVARCAKCKAILHLPSGLRIGFETLDVPLGNIVNLARQALNDPQIASEGFGTDKYFFFVNSTTGSLLDSHLDLRRPLKGLCVSEGNVIELRLCKPSPEPDGTILNPMRGVTKYVK